MSLESLPDEMIFEIMDRMRLKECLALACVNKNMSEKLYKKNVSLTYDLYDFMYSDCKKDCESYSCKHSEKCSFKKDGKKCKYNCPYDCKHGKDCHKWCKFSWLNGFGRGCKKCIKEEFLKTGYDFYTWNEICDRKCYK